MLFLHACGKKTIQPLFVLLLTSQPRTPLLILTISLSFFSVFLLLFLLFLLLLPPPFGPGVSSFGLPASSWLPASFSACVCASDAPCGQMTAGRCHTLLSPVTEESGEEGTNSEVSSPPACRSPSPGPNADTPANQVLGSRPHPPTLAAPASASQNAAPPGATVTALSPSMSCKRFSSGIQPRSGCQTKCDF